MTAPVDVASLTKIAQGAEAEIFEWEDGKVLRLPFRTGDHRGVERETLAITAAKQAGLRVTEHFGSITVNERVGQVLERLDGPDLLDDLAKRPWTMRRQAVALGKFHARLNGISAPFGLPSVLTVFREAINGPVQEVQKPFVERARAVFERLTDGAGFLHGDFHPGNVMMHQGRQVLIDWPNASAGPPEADVARTLVLWNLAELPPGTPRHALLIAKVARRLFGRWYLASYRKACPLDEAALDDWYTAQLLGRIAEQMSDTERTRIGAELEVQLG